jgi:hypothetical protein
VTPTEPKRRWYQFSLRTLVVFVTICAIPCSWLAVKMKQARVENAAIEKLPARQIGWHYDLSVRFVSLSRNAGLEHLKKLRNLEVLKLDGWQFSDSALEHLYGLSQIQCLELWYTQITDAGLKHLEYLPKLERLDLRGTHITDDGLKHVIGLSRLKALGLPYT